MLGRGRIIAQRSDRIWNRSCSYSGSRISIEACVDSSSGYEDHYRCGITIDEAADEVVDYHCTCPAARRYPGPCKHSIALALDFNRNAGAYKGHSPQGQTGTSRVLGDYLDRACAPAPVRVASAADAAPGTVGLKVTLEHEHDWYLRLRIAGPRGSYVVRDVGDLAQDIMARSCTRSTCSTHSHAPWRSFWCAPCRTGAPSRLRACRRACMACRGCRRPSAASCGSRRRSWTSS